MSVVVQFALASAVVFGQGLAGAWVWSWLRPRSSVLERIGMGLALGTATSAVTGIALFLIQPRLWLLPIMLIAVLAIALRLRRGVWFPETGVKVRRSQIAAVGVGLITGLGSILWAWRTYPLSGSGDAYHGDMLFFQAVADSLASLGPSDSTLMIGSQLRYHWMTYAWSGQISDLVAPEPFLVLTRILPIAALLGAVLITVSWTGRVSRHPWAPMIAVLLLVTGGYVGASFGTILNFDSPSQQLSTVWLLALSVAFLAALRGRRMTWLLIVVAFLAAATTAGKVSAGAVVLFGMGAVAVVGAVRGEPWRGRALTTFAVAAVACLAAFVAWIAGGNDAGGLGIGFLDKMATVIGLNPVRGTVGVILGTVILLVAISARWIGAAWLLADPTTRRRPWVVLATAMGTVGLFSVVVLGQGINDSWFALSASAPLAVASGAGLGLALRRAGMFGIRPTQQVVVMALGGAVAMLLVVVLWRQPGDATRWLGPFAAIGVTALFGLLAMRGRMGTLIGLTIGLTVTAALGRALPVAGSLVSTREGTRIPSEFTLADSFELIDTETTVRWDQDARDAGSWLRTETSLADVIATNRTRSPLVAALTGRPTYLSGGHYQGPYGPAGSIEEVQRRDARIQSFLNDPNDATWQPLCDAGVTWLWIDPSMTSVRDWSPYADTRVAESSVILAQARSVC